MARLRQLRLAGPALQGGACFQDWLSRQPHAGEKRHHHRRAEWRGEDDFAREFLPQEAGCLNFINADLIAQGLSPFRPEAAALRAGRLMLQMVADHVRRGESFAIETTLSGRAYAQMIPIWKQAGYLVRIFFLELPSANLAVERVAIRVAQGGHHIPKLVIRRRFTAGKENFLKLYQPLADTWRHYDNAGKKPLLMASSDYS